MAYFIDRDKYFTFSENVKENNTVNKITIQVLQNIASQEDIVLNTSERFVVDKVLDEQEYNNGKHIYYVDDISLSRTVAYQTTTEELNKYKTILFRVLGLQTTATKKTSIRNTFGNLQFGKTDLDISVKYGPLQRDSVDECVYEDWSVIAEGICSIDDSLVARANIYTPHFYQEADQSVKILWLSAGNIGTYTGTSIFYDYVFVEFFGRAYNFEYTPIVKENSVSDIVKYNVDLENNSLIQPGTRYNDTNIIDKISTIAFDNFANGRPVAVLEWIGSPEVTYGTEIKVEPRREYNLDDLIEYVVVGKDVIYDGGYKEKLYLIKKEK